MEKKTLPNNLHDEISCSVCTTTFTDSKQLPCLHSFCLHCLEGILRTSGRRDVISCPECKRESRVPSSGNLNDLPTNFRIKSLLDVLAIKECNTSTSVKCGNCDQKSSHSLYCFECCAFWCDDCIAAHNIIRANKEHRLIDNVLKRPAFCGKPGHEKKELEFFCKKCDEPICNSCVATIHDGHAKILLDEAANERKAKAKSLIESQKKMGQQIRNKIFQVDENCAKIREEVVNVKRKVQKFADNVMAIIEAKVQDIFNEVENEGQQSLEGLEIQRKEFEQQDQMIETAVEKAEALLEQSTSAEIAQLDDSSLITIFEEGEQVDGDLEPVPNFSFVENETLLEKAITEGIGSVKTFLDQPSVNHSKAEGSGIREAIVGLEAQFVLTTRNAKGERYYDKCDCVTVEMTNRQGQDCLTERRLEDNTDGSYKISYFSKETGKCVVSVKVNEQHIHGSPFAVQVKPKQFNSVSVFSNFYIPVDPPYKSTPMSLGKPWGVAANDRNVIAVSVTDNDNTKVQIFSAPFSRTRQRFLRCFGKKGNKEGEFNFPTGIAFDIKNKNLFVADYGNHRVQLFSEQGEFLNQFGGKGNLDHQLEFPLGLSVDSNGNVIVADSGNKAIKIFSPGGRFLRKIGEEGSFNYPYHCVQCDNHFIVSDSDENSIKVFARDGNFLYKFGKCGEGDGDFNRPRCLSVDKAGHLVVCDEFNDRVQVFELSGKFVTKFGRKGSEGKELNNPVSTAVLSDGKIVVCDLGNHRIQIFQ